MSVPPAVDLDTGSANPLSSFEMMLALHRPDPTVRVWPGEAPSPPEPPIPAGPRSQPASGHMEALTAGLGATARIVLHLAPDLDLTFPQIAYTALWAPRVAADMALRDSSTAFLSRDTLSQTTGLSGQKAMLPGGVVEACAATVGLVRMVARGVPGAVGRTDAKGWRGEATSWTVTRNPEEFTHRPARTGHAGTAVPEPGRSPLDPGELDRAAVDTWADPRFCWWRSRAAGPTGLRLIAILLTRFGVTDVLLRTADVAALAGVHRQTAWLTMRGLDRLGLACKEGKHGPWRVRIASHLAHLTGDDLKYLTRRPPAPGLQRAQVHDWGWFSPEGRYMRKRARTVLTDVPDVTQEVVVPDATRTDARTGWLRGALMGTIEMLRHCDQMGHAAAEKAMRRLLRPERDEAGPWEPESPVRAPAADWGAVQDRPGPAAAMPRPAPAAAVARLFDNTAPFTPGIASVEEGLDILRRGAEERAAQARARALADPEPRRPLAAPQQPAQDRAVAVPDIPGLDIRRNLSQADADWLTRMAPLLVPRQPVAE